MTGYPQDSVAYAKALAAQKSPETAALVDQLIEVAETARREGFEAGLVADKWQPIETAPKDGTEILLLGNLVPPCVDAGEKSRVIAYWTDHNSGGWVWHGAPSTKFTHWQPLPALPS